jgi:spermidine synthase/MFS family permease
MYEIAWSKYLSLFIGNTTYSHMIVLATFMGGLALGAWYWGTFADRSRNHLRLYGILELLIGGYCFAYPVVIRFCEGAFIHSASLLEISSGSASLVVIKFLLSFSTLIVPTFLMGGTLPILTKYFVRDTNQTGANVALLYFTNSLGAVAGSVAAGFFLIRFTSLDTTVWIAASLNVLIGGSVLLATRATSGKNAPPATSVTQHENSTAHFSRKIVSIAVIAAAVSGFTAMIYELTWVRLLSNILGSSTYSFTLMLTAFIGGIALGSLIISFLLKRLKNVVGLLAACQLGTSFVMLITIPLYERLPYYLVKLAAVIAKRPDNYPIFLSLEFVYCFAVMIVPTTLSGMSLPIASHIAGSEMKILGKSVGGIFSINTIGTVAGALVTGLLFIPLIGVQLSLEVGIVINGLLGLMIIVAGTAIRDRTKIAFAILIFASFATYQYAYQPWNVQSSISGVFRGFEYEPPASFQEFLEPYKGRRMLWYKEGVNANVAVVEIPGDADSVQRGLIINGKTDATTQTDLATQTLLAQIPLLVMPDSGEALIVGLGSGITAASALTHPIRSVDCVEISSEVIECNSFFARENRNVTADRRFRLHNEDGITYLKLSDRKFDYIINEPSNPWIAGIGNLFSREFFELCKNRLTPHGVLAQWFHTYELNDDIFTLVLHTLSSEFPYVMIWSPNEGDIILLSSTFPIPVDFDVLRHRMSQPAVADDLSRIDIGDVATLLSTQSTTYLPKFLFSAQGEINTEQHPLLEFMAPVCLFAPTAMNIPTTVDDRYSGNRTDLWFTRYEKRHPLTTKDYLAIGRYHSQPQKDFKMAFSAFTKALRLEPTNADALAGLVRVTDALKLSDERRVALKTLATLYPNDPVVLSQFAQEGSRQEDQSASMANVPAMTDPIRLFSRCTELTNKEDERYFLALGTVLSSAGRFLEAAEAYKAVRDIRTRFEAVATEVNDDDVLCLEAECYYNADNSEKASSLLKEMGSTSEGNVKARTLTEKILQRSNGAF